MANKKNLDKKKEKVIKLSAELFFRNGYVNTGLNEILKVCNIPKGSLYYYFTNKEDLLLKVIDYHTNRITKLFEETVDDLSIYKLKSFFSKFLNTIAIIDDYELKNLDEQLFNFNTNELFKTNTGKSINKFYGGSPLGNLNAELSNISDEVNKKLNFAFYQLETRVYLFLETLSLTNPKYRTNNVAFYTYTLLNNLEGTCLKLKRNKKEEVIDEFLNFFDILVEKMINDK